MYEVPARLQVILNGLCTTWTRYNLYLADVFSKAYMDDHDVDQCNIIDPDLNCVDANKPEQNKPT